MSNTYYDEACRKVEGFEKMAVHFIKRLVIDGRSWLDNREAALLPVNYMHMVFTIPDKLKPLFLHHQEDCYNILFRVVNQVMTDHHFD
jgi:hypothetical protein